ncbi:glutamine--tRNA ligase/YqeY domain fusion protein [Sediminispirochaeta bajacaliforniensis]|uniref:glutamine--tRNA ligase/YqeY domain fusion protein n=1 Tax=Sediminispirochaeta bajacaliforniensis TaxID=148 RepID=UPI000364EC99|nr:glutamine--tRNA ligase/YqeY domain fusion protein [Sediminispirochaeta bajacaliforniensis]
MADAEKSSLNFIERIIEDDFARGKHSQVVTRFPPEPNGYLHIGHAKSICLNFGLAKKYGGRCHLRFDDTNPEKESLEYIESIKRDVQWLGFSWGTHEYYASDYFEELYKRAVRLIKAGKAYVDDLSPEQMREYRGTLTKPGKESPNRTRSIEENLDLFERMRKGEFPDGSMLLRAKIDMASGNMNMRDPALYRIRRVNHHRTGDAWCIYPMYDFTHPLSDAIEGITHSICTLEFEDHRPLYDWSVEETEMECHPRQIEFARLNLTYTVMSKRILLQLVMEGHVSGWDDPRMPTISGLRRRGYTPEAIRQFADIIGVAKVNSTVDMALLEHCLREDLNLRALRVMVVLDPVKVVIDNYPEGKEEMLEAENNPEDPDGGMRMVPFSREVYIEREDFMEDPPKKFFRLAPGREIRLKHAYYITCVSVEKNESGKITTIHCTYDPESRGGGTPDGRRVKGTSHWVSVAHAKEIEVRLYDNLFTSPEPGSRTGNFLDDLNSDSLSTIKAMAEPSLTDAEPEAHYQFLRKGYFTVDPKESKKGAPVFNRTATLRDSWAKLQKKIEA